MRAASRSCFPPARLAASGVEVEVASGRDLSLVVELPGEAVPNADRLAHIVPRFPGITKAVEKNARRRRSGRRSPRDHREQREPVAVRGDLAHLRDDHRKHITLGEFVRDDADIFIVADLSTVWINITVYARDLANVKRGLRVEVVAVGGFPKASGSIDYIGPVLGEATRAANRSALGRKPTTSLATGHVRHRADRNRSVPGTGRGSRRRRPEPCAARTSCSSKKATPSNPVR
jgi:hypothetical protein